MLDSFHETINRPCLGVFGFTFFFSMILFVLACVVAHKKFNQINVPFVFTARMKNACIPNERPTAQEQEENISIY